MSPRSSFFDFLNARIRYVVMRADVGNSVSLINSEPNYVNGGRIQLMLSIIFSLCIFGMFVPMAQFSHHPPVVSLHSLESISSLGIAIPIVVQIGAEEKMFWIAARGIVASVTNQKIIRNRAVKNHPNGTVSQDRIALDVALPIARIFSESGPFPTITRGINSRFNSQQLSLGENDFLTLKNKGHTRINRHITNSDFVLCLAPNGRNKLPIGASFLTTGLLPVNRK